jgi:hypothetical protein
MVVTLLGQVGDHQAHPEGAFPQSVDAEVSRHRRTVSALQGDFPSRVGSQAVAQ